MLKMLAHTVGVSAARSVAQLRAVEDPGDPKVGGGIATIIIRDPDALDTFEEGSVYEVTFRKLSDAEAGVDAQTAAMRAAAVAIPNSTNTRNFQTPTHQKVPQPVAPDGVVTLPRPSVVLEPAAPTPTPTPTPPAKKP